MGYARMRYVNIQEYPRVLQRKLSIGSLQPYEIRLRKSGFEGQLNLKYTTLSAIMQKIGFIGCVGCVNAASRTSGMCPFG